MTKPLIISIPHALGREEARRRLKRGIFWKMHFFRRGVVQISQLASGY